MRLPESCASCPHARDGLFAVLPAPALHQVGQRKRTSLYRRGQIVFHEGNTPFGLFCVFSGAVKVAKAGPAGREQIVRLAHPGDVLGYRALFAEEPYTATAVTLEDSLLCLVPRDTVLPLLTRCPALALAVIKRLAHDLRTAEEWVRDMALMNARQRLAETLLMLQGTHGIRGREGTRLSLLLPRQELAEMAGLATETAIRLLGELRSRGILSIRGREVTIRDPRALLRLSGLRGIAGLADAERARA
jgi:CRP/FNR family transcriptional regulator